MKYQLIDLAGFNPAEARAGGKWTAGGAQGKQPAKGAKSGASQKKANRARLLAERVQLTAEAKHLRSEINALTPGVHRGPKGTTSSKAKASTKARKATKATVAKAAKGTATKKGGTSLAAQVANLQTEVAHLKVVLLAAKRKYAARHK